MGIDYSKVVIKNVSWESHPITPTNILYDISIEYDGTPYNVNGSGSFGGAAYFICLTLTNGELSVVSNGTTTNPEDTIPNLIYVMGQSAPNNSNNKWRISPYMLWNIPTSVFARDNNESDDFDVPPHHCTPTGVYYGKMNNYKYPGVPPKGRKKIE